MIRRYFPKGTSLDAISPADVARAADKLNNLPRPNWVSKRQLSASSASSARRIAPLQAPENPLVSVFGLSG